MDDYILDIHLLKMVFHYHFSIIFLYNLAFVLCRLSCCIFRLFNIQITLP